MFFFRIVANRIPRAAAFILYLEMKFSTPDGTVLALSLSP